jgi:ADP-heptose:LPS heptosyltransferase
MLLPMERPAATLRAADRILIVRLGALGDVLRALPAVRRLRAAFPGNHLGWIVEDLSAPLLQDHPDIDEVVVLKRSELRRATRNPQALAGLVARTGRRLRSSGFTVAIDLQSSLKSGLVTLLSGAPRRVGFAPGFCREMSFLFTTEWVPLRSPWLNRVDRNLEMAAALGAPRQGAGWPDESTALLPERPREGDEAEALLASLVPPGTPRVLLSPGASHRQAFKMWPARCFARLADGLRRTHGVRSVVVWGPGEETLAEEVVRASAGAATAAPSTNLRLLASVVRRANVLVAADTGPMHLAWVVGCPVIALFGPTDPRLNAPRGPGDIVLRASSGAMADLPPSAVLEAVGGMLETPPPRTPHDGGVGSPPHASWELQ